MKQKIIILLAITVLILSTFSFGVLATNITEPEAPGIDNTENIPEPSTDNSTSGNISKPSPDNITSEDSSKTSPDNVTSENDTNVEEIPEIPASMIVSETDIKRDYCIVLDNLLMDNKYVAHFKEEKQYPFIVDLTSFDSPIDSIAFPESLLEILIGKEPSVANTTTVATNDVDTEDTQIDAATDTNTTVESSDNQSSTLQNNAGEIADTHANDFVLKVITENKEYSWKTTSLKNINITNGVVKISLASADHTLETATSHNETTLKFNPEDGKTNGVLFVSKDDADQGNWNVSSEYFFGSMAMCIISVVILVLFIFALIIAVNLIIIKIYRTKK